MSHDPPRGKEFGQAIRLMPVDLAPLRVRRDAEILVDSGAGCLIRWHLTRGPWSALPPAAIGALRGFHHAVRVARSSGRHIGTVRQLHYARRYRTGHRSRL